LYGYWYNLSPRSASSDTWMYHQMANEAYQLLRVHSTEYWRYVFENTHEGSVLHNILSSSDSYLKDLAGKILVCLLSIFNVFTKGYYYANVIVFSFLTLPAYIYTYQLFEKMTKAQNVWVVLIIFFSPSLLFFCGGIHKDGLCFLLLSFVLYHFFALKNDNQKIWPAIQWLIGFCLLFIMRSYLALLLLPPILACGIAARYTFEKRTWVLGTFAIVYFIGGVLFFSSKYIGESMNLPRKIIEKQASFNALEGTSRIEDTLALKGNAGSFLAHAPAALAHTLLQPSIFHSKTSLEKVSAIEMILWWAICTFLFFVQGFGITSAIHPFFKWFIVFYSASILLLIGYTVPFTGAIVRYRCIVLMLMAALVASKKVPPDGATIVVFKKLIFKP
jgi:hypothetical protein